LKTTSFLLLVALLAIIPLIANSDVEATDTIELTATDTHHVAELNSDQPYVAGYHVNTPDLYTREGVEATAVTVSFPSTDPAYFPSDSWLGGGMFVQAQDSKFRNVDYAFYTMLVLDASGRFFVDLGLHQTRESTAPIQMPTEELVYAYTWQVSGVDPVTPVTLLARWDSDGFVHYSLSTSEAEVNIVSVQVVAFPNCENIIRQFYAGNAVAGTAFPFGHYVYYFQFGVVGSKIIADDHWSVYLLNPRILRKPEWRLGTGWHPVEVAWSAQGDMSYLDYDWMWGGAPYYGVSAHYYENPLEDPYEVVFFYNGETLPRGTVLWQNESSKTRTTATFSSMHLGQTFRIVEARPLPIETVVLAMVTISVVSLRRLRKRRL